MSLMVIRPTRRLVHPDHSLILRFGSLLLIEFGFKNSAFPHCDGNSTKNTILNGFCRSDQQVLMRCSFAGNGNQTAGYQQSHPQTR